MCKILVINCTHACIQFSLLHLLPTQAIIANGTGSHANTVLCIVMPIQ